MEEGKFADQRDNLTRFMMHGNLKTSGAELVAEKAASNRGRGRGSGPGHPPKKVGLYKLRLLGRLVGREEVGEDEKIVVYLAYHDRKGGPPRQGRASPLHYGTKPKIDILVNFCLYPHLYLLVLYFFEFATNT